MTAEELIRTAGPVLRPAGRRDRRDGGDRPPDRAVGGLPPRGAVEAPAAGDDPAGYGLAAPPGRPRQGAPGLRPGRHPRRGPGLGGRRRSRRLRSRTVPDGDRRHRHDGGRPLDRRGHFRERGDRGSHIPRRRHRRGHRRRRAGVTLRSRVAHAGRPSPARRRELDRRGARAQDHRPRTPAPRNSPISVFDNHRAAAYAAKRWTRCRALGRSRGRTRRMPVGEAFNWADGATELGDGSWYLVAFRSIRRADADEERLAAYDEFAHQEAATAPGFVHYLKGPAAADGSCLSFCLWQSRDEARAAAAPPGPRPGRQPPRRDVRPVPPRVPRRAANCRTGR